MSELSRYLKAPARISRQLWVWTTILCLLAIYAFVQAYLHGVVAARAERQIIALRKAQAVKPAPKVSRRALEEQKRWTALKAERDFSWAPLFAAVERASNPDIELLEFQPDKGSRRVTLRGESRDQNALNAFLNALALQPALKNVHLTHQRNIARDRLLTVEFEVKASLAD